MKAIAIVLILIVLLVSGCTSSLANITGSCEPEWIIPDKAIISTDTEARILNDYCKSLCYNDFRVTKFKIEAVNSAWAYCYCDVNNCD